MVIIKQVSGQLANRLHFFSYFVANSKAYDYALLVTCFPEYYDLFAPVDTDNLKVTFTRRGIYPKILNKVLNVIQALSNKMKGKLPGFVFHSIPELDLQLEQYDMNLPEFINLVQHTILIPQGWVYRDYVNFKKYLPEVRNLFSPRQEFKDEIKRHSETARNQGDVVIGVHIRRGDYIDFNGGKWYYGNDVYLDKMRQTERLFEGKQCVFIICSQEELRTEEFSGFKAQIAKRPAIVDLYLLAECDYMMGPPSTFTGWASLYNTIPACYIETAGQQITLQSFKPFFD